MRQIKMPQITECHCHQAVMNLKAGTLQTGTSTLRYKHRLTETTRFSVMWMNMHDLN